MAEQQAELMVIGFEGKHRAAEVLAQVEALDLSFAIDLKDAVAVYRTSNGRLRVDTSVQPTTKEGAAWGAVLGGSIGAILLAPFTAGASAAVAASTIGMGALTGSLTGAALGADDADTWKRNFGIPESFVQQVGGMVQPGQSAVFILARSSDPVAVAEKFRGYGGKVLRTTLPKDAASKIENALTSVTTSAR
jgi:uncharacterized membrane protein